MTSGPPKWLVLALCAVLASLAPCTPGRLRSLLTASPPHRYPWWFVTALFVHADRTVIPLYPHLVTNVAVIAFFGREAERRLGSARLAVLVASAVAAQLAASRAMVDLRRPSLGFRMGAVGMVEMVLERLEQGSVVELDDERRAAMVSNLLVIPCGTQARQPVVNTGTLYG